MSLRTLKLQAACEAVLAVARRAAEEGPVLLADLSALDTGDEQLEDVEEALHQTWLEMVDVLATRQLQLSVLCAHQSQHVRWARH